MDRRILCSSGTSCDGFKSSKIVKWFVGFYVHSILTQTTKLQRTFALNAGNRSPGLGFCFTNKESQPRNVCFLSDSLSEWLASSNSGFVLMRRKTGPREKDELQRWRPPTKHFTVKQPKILFIYFSELHLTNLSDIEKCLVRLCVNKVIFNPKKAGDKILIEVSYRRLANFVLKSVKCPVNNRHHFLS